MGIGIDAFIKLFFHTILYFILCFNTLCNILALQLENNKNNNFYTFLTAPSFLFGKPKRIQRPPKNASKRPRQQK